MNFRSVQFKLCVFFLILVSGFCRGQQGLMPGQFSQQDAAIHLAASFLGYIDQGEIRNALSAVSPDLLNLHGYNAALNNLVQIKNSLQGGGLERIPVGVEMSAYGLIVRFRSIYPAGAIIESITVGLLPDGNLCIVAWHFQPAQF